MDFINLNVYLDGNEMFFRVCKKIKKIFCPLFPHFSVRFREIFKLPVIIPNKAGPKFLLMVIICNFGFESYMNCSEVVAGHFLSDVFG